MILMQAPAPNMTFGAMPSGSTYVSDQNSLIRITNDSTADQTALAAAGCFTLSPFGGWGTYGFNLLTDLYSADTGSLFTGITGFPQHTVATIFSDASNVGLWCKTGSGSGSGNWTQVINSLTPDANAVIAQSAATLATNEAGLAAAAAAISGRPYPNVFASQVPQGITSIAIGGTAITGATPGTYPLTFTGGSYTGMSASLVVDTSTTAHIVFGTTPEGKPAYGLNITGGTTLPTIANPAGATLPVGTTLTPSAGVLITPEIQTYWVQSSDGTQILLYGNHSGAATPAGAGTGGTFFGGTQFAMYSKTGVDGVSAALYASSTQIIGRQVDPVDGSSASAATYLWLDPVANTGSLTSFKIFAHATGTLQIARYTKSGSNYTRVATSSVVTIGSTGLKTLTSADFGSFPVNAGDYLALNFSAGGVLTFTNLGASDGTGFVTLAGSLPAGPIAGTAGNSSYRLEGQWLLGYTVQVVTSANFTALQNSLNGTVSQIIGRPAGASLDGSAASAASANAYFPLQPVTTTGTLAKLEIYAKTAGTIAIRRFSVSGSTATLIASYAQAVSSGINTITSFSAGTVPVNAGEYLAVTGLGIVAYVTTGADANAPYYQVTPTGGTATALAGYTFFVRYTVQSIQQVVNAGAFQALTGTGSVIPYSTSDYPTRDAAVYDSARNIAVRLTYGQGDNAGVQLVFNSSGTVTGTRWVQKAATGGVTLATADFTTINPLPLTIAAGVSSVALIIGIGQSLMNGWIAAGASPDPDGVLDNTRLFMFPIGTAPYNTGTLTLSYTDAQLGAMVALQNPGNTNVGVGPRMAKVVQAGLGSAYGVAFVTASVNGQSYVNLKQGTVPYNNALAAIRRARLMTWLGGVNMTVRIACLHGEADQAAVKATYLGYLNEWQSTFQADVRALMQDDSLVPTITLSQMSSWTSGSIVRSEVPLAQLEAMLDNPTKFICVGPRYHLPYSDTQHLTAASYRKHGEELGLARPGMYVASATRSGTTVIATVTNKSGNLVIDTSLVSDPGNYGITYRDGSGNPIAVSGVSILDAVAGTIQFTIASAVAGVAEFGTRGVSGNGGGPTTGPRTCFRDSASDISGVDGSNLYKWMCHWEVPVS